MSNKDNTRVMTLHPDEHVAIIIDRVGNNAYKLDNIDFPEHLGPNIRDSIDELYNIVDELESLRSYLRAQRLGEYS